MVVGTTIRTLGCQIPSPGSLGRQIPNVRTFGRQIPATGTLGCQIPATAPTTLISGMPELDPRGPSHVFGIWENKRKEPKVWEIGGSTRSRNQKTLQWAKKKIGKKKNNSLALTIPHKNVREIIKSICTAGGPRRRHHRQGTATKAQREGLTPILGFGAVRGARVGPQKGSSGGWMDTGDC